jgi:hypothetical protein
LKACSGNTSRIIDLMLPLSPRRERWRRLTLVLAGTVLGLLIAEGVARRQLPAPWYSELYEACEDPLVGVDLRASADFAFEGAWVEIPTSRVTISAKGLRDEQVVAPKPPGIRRLLCLGDSWTFGWGVEQADCFCSRLDGLLGDGWETVNLGVPGQNTAQEVRRLALHGLAFEPDLVLVQHEEGDLEPPLDISNMDTPGAFLASHLALYRLVLRAQHAGQAWSSEDWEPGEHGVVGADGWDGLAESRAAFASLAELGRERRFEVVVFTDAPHLGELVGSLEGAGIHHASLLPALDGPEEELFIPEDGHWTAEGHRRVAELMASTLRELGLAP